MNRCNNTRASSNRNRLAVSLVCVAGGARWVVNKHLLIRSVWKSGSIFRSNSIIVASSLSLYDYLGWSDDVSFPPLTMLQVKKISSLSSVYSKEIPLMRHWTIVKEFRHTWESTSQTQSNRFDFDCSFLLLFTSSKPTHTARWELIPGERSNWSISASFPSSFSPQTVRQGVSALARKCWRRCSSNWPVAKACISRERTSEKKWLFLANYDCSAPLSSHVSHSRTRDTRAASYVIDKY